MEAALFFVLLICKTIDVGAGDTIDTTFQQRWQRRHLQQNPGVAAKPLIVGGMDGPCGRFPYMVSLKDRDNVHRCGGVLVHPLWVLTAAHCVDPDGSQSLGATPVVVIGACNLNDDKNENGIVEKQLAKATFIHPNYQTDNVESGYDAALLMLSMESKHDLPGLPASNDVLKQNKLLVVLGWGKIGGGGSPSDLQIATEINTISNEVCKAEGVWGDIILDSMICALGFSGQDACDGDSGGPLLDAFAPHGNFSAGNPGLDIIWGITSFGDNKVLCQDSFRPSVFTRFTSIRGWMDKVIEASGEPVLPTPSPPPASSSPQNSSLVVITSIQQDLLDQKLWNAAMNGELDAVKEALMEGANIEIRMGCCGSTPLIVAAELGHLSIVEELLTEDADIDAANDSGMTSLFFASANGQLDVVDAILKAGADVDRPTNDGATPLFVASTNGHLDVVKALIKARAEVNKATNTGATPLAAASLKGRSSMVNALLQANANPDLGNNVGDAPLHLASATLGARSEQIVNALLEAKAIINARTGVGATPLIWAAYYGNIGTSKILLAQGADRSIADNRGATASDQICACLGDVGKENYIQCPKGGCDKPESSTELKEILK